MSFGPDHNPTDGEVVKMEDDHDYEWRDNPGRWTAISPDDPNTTRLICTTTNCPGPPPRPARADGLLRRDIASGNLDRWSQPRARWEAHA